ncbi:Protein CutA, partial [Lemmus lemmus]
RAGHVGTRPRSSCRLARRPSAPPLREAGQWGKRGPGLARSEDPQEGEAAPVTWPPPSLGCMSWGRAPVVLLGGGATLLVSILWMPALLPLASRLLLLPRALLSMASGSPPSQPSPASGSGYVPGSVSAAFVTCPDEKVAKKIARWGPGDLQGRAGYEWKGKIEEDSEVLMMIKTQSSLVPALTEFVRSVHPYEVAEVIALPVEQGNPPYLHWVRQVTETITDSSTAPSSA